MENGLVDSTARIDVPDDRRINGVTVATVVSNCDHMSLGRAQIKLPWLAGYQPWARVASIMTGSKCGAFFIPQQGDEVLVAFNHGDVTEPYIVGSVWNGKDPSPSKDPESDPINKRLIRTPKGHEIEFDDAAGSISITSADKKHITLTKDHIEVAIDEKATSAITIDSSGNVTIKAKNSITLDAPTINVTASQNLALGGSRSARIDGGSYCSIDAGLIKIG